MAKMKVNYCCSCGNKFFIRFFYLSLGKDLSTSVGQDVDDYAIAALGQR